MENRSGAQISKRAFLQSVIILAVMMLFAGVLTRVVPAGDYQYTMVDGRLVIVPGSFQYIPSPNYPIWRWFTAPLEVLAGPDSTIVITILIFILLIGGAFAVLEKSGILNAALAKIVAVFGGQKYALLLVITLFFMSLGAFFGLFEETIPLVPIMVALSYSLGWDVLVGLGMSVLATNMGFSAAITNPFTIGISQRIAGLPMFSGALFRAVIFLVVYAVMAVFLMRYAKRIERRPQSSLVFGEEHDKVERARFQNGTAQFHGEAPPVRRAAVVWFSVFLVLIVCVFFASPFVPILALLSLPLVGLLFFIGGMGAGLLSGAEKKGIWKALGDGIIGIAPGIPLVLMAASIKYIIAAGQVIDTIIHSAALRIADFGPYGAIILMYALALLLEVFIASGSAKAVLVMPILIPLADLVGITRQMTVTAYCFGDGFSNLAYPTNPVLLIVLGLSMISYGKWMRWTLKLWLVVIPLTIFFLWLGIWLGVGPF